MIYHCVKDDCRFWGEGDAVPQRCPQCGAPLVQAKEGELTGDAWSALGVFWVEQDGHEARALECFRKSAQMGSGWGTCNLGLCMEQGIGVKADPLPGRLALPAGGGDGQPVRPVQSGRVL